MGMFTLTSPKIYLDGFDISGDLNQHSLNESAAAVTNTTYGTGYESALPGRKGVDLSMAGYWQAGATPDLIDHILADRIAVENSVLTVCGQTGAAGESAKFFRAMVGSYAPGGQVGAMLAFSASAKANQGPVVRGTVLATGSKTSTANGSAYQVGAAGATQSLYAALHVLSVSGTNPTLNVVIASDNNSGFTSGLTRMTFSQKTAIGTQWLTPVAGPQTDDYWRAEWTIGGSNTPTFNFVVVFGIL